MSPKLLKQLMYMLAISALLLVACGQGAATAAPEEAAAEEVEAPAEEGEAAAPEEPMEAEGAEEPSEEPTPELQPAEPQAMQITTDDGRTLQGTYYPSAVDPAPIVVLMNWLPGDKEDWVEIAPWLQNRQDELASLSRSRKGFGSSSRQAGDPWLDPSWFPMMPADATFAVLTFNYGDVGPVDPFNLPPEWVDDVLAAIKAAAHLEGVDPDRIVAIGASVGADGAVDGCYMFNALDNSGTCLGALSLSPGDYLPTDFTYREAVKALDDDGHPVWCLAAVEDFPPFGICEMAKGSGPVLYRAIYYPAAFHGMMLIQPELYPLDPPMEVDTLVIIQDFLEEVFGVILN
jgi:hypothetical protein